jgi:hypothetical protein
MKNDLACMIAGVVLTVGLSACDDVTTPQGILATAGDKIQKNDFDGFQGLLLGDARRAYGTPSGFKTIQELLKDRSLSTADPTLENETGDAYDFVRVYSDSILDSNVPIVDAKIDCHTVSPDPSTTTAADPSLVPGTQCRIFEIRLGSRVE